MKELAVNELDPLTSEFLNYNTSVSLILLIAFIFTIAYSAKKGGIKEVIENLFLFLLLGGGLLQLSLYPVDTGDEMTAGIFFVAFGLCRIGKHIANKTPPTTP